MKKIFNILMIAAVALGAVACDNAIDDNLTPEYNGESLSISVIIEQPTKVEFTGDTQEVEGQTQHKIGFVEGDQLYVTPTWAGEGGYYFTFTKQEGETAVFTCDAEGVSALKGTSQNVFYLGGRKDAIGAYCNTAAEDISGILLTGAGKIDGTISLYNRATVLKLKSDDPVTITASVSLFYVDGNHVNTYTTKTTGEYIYLPLCFNSTGDVELTFNAKNREPVTTTIAVDWSGKIYNFGYIQTPVILPDVANITIDGDFADWDDVKVNVATLPNGVSYTNLKTLKSYYGDEKINVYIEFDHTNVRKLDIFVDPDYSNATGNIGNWGQNGSSIFMQNSIYNWNSDKTIQGEAIAFYVDGVNKYTGADGADVWSWSWVGYGPMVESCVPAYDEETGITRLELSFVKDALDKALETVVSGSVGIGVILENASGATIGRLPASASGSSAASMLLIEVPAAE